MSNKRKLRRKGGPVAARKLTFIEECASCGGEVDDTGTKLSLACPCGWRVESDYCQGCLDSDIGAAFAPLVMMLRTHGPSCDGDWVRDEPSPSLTASTDRRAT